MTDREEFIAYVSAVLAGTVGLEDVRLVKSVRAVDELSKPVLVVGRPTYEKLPAAPIKKRLATFPCTLISPHVDTDRAEDDLDARLEILLPKLFTSGLMWTEARGTSWDELHLAFDIDIQSILS